MSGEYKITIYRDGREVEAFSVTSGADIVVGRSSKCDVTISGDASISKRQLLLRVTPDGSLEAEELGRFGMRVGATQVAEGERRILVPGDNVLIGSVTELRIEEVSGGGGDADQKTAATFVGEAPAEAPGATVATRVPDEPALDALRGAKAAGAATGERTSAAPEPDGTLATRLPAGADPLPPSATVTASSAGVPTSTGTFATKVPAWSGKESANSEQTVSAPARRSIDFSMLESDLPTADEAQDGVTGTGTGTGGGDDGKTRVIETHIASMEELEAAKRSIDRPRKVRRTVMMFFTALFFAALVCIYIFTKRDLETDWMSLPEPAKLYVVRDAKGDYLMFTRYPYMSAANVEELPNKGGVEITNARMGRDRDVPYYARFECTSSPEELKLSLEQSVWQWISRLRTRESGIMFEVQSVDEIKPGFFEYDNPGACENGARSAYGVRYVRLLYQHSRSDSGEVWRGVLTYLRSGDAVYALRREIPEKYWKRGEGFLKAVPGICLAVKFINNYWESPGLDAILDDWPQERLLSEARAELNRDRPGIWGRVASWIDAYLITAWNDKDARSQGLELLNRLRDYQNKFYMQEYNAFEAARAVDNEKRMRSIRQNCKAVFDNPRDVRFLHVNGTGIWGGG